MSRIQLSTCGLVAVLIASFASTARGQAMSPVDGYWVIQLTADDASIRKGAASFEERALIESGKFTVEAFSYYGFPAQDLTFLSTSPTYTFEAVMAAEKFGSIKWVGERQSATRITGTLTWTRNDGEVWNYTFVANKGTPPSEES
jgi:hypothetical protein